MKQRAIHILHCTLFLSLSLSSSVFVICLALSNSLILLFFLSDSFKIIVVSLSLFTPPLLSILYSFLSFSTNCYFSFKASFSFSLLSRFLFFFLAFYLYSSLSSFVFCAFLLIFNFPSCSLPFFGLFLSRTHSLHI